RLAQHCRHRYDTSGHSSNWFCIVRLVRLAEGFPDKANLLAHTCFGVLAVLNALLDQNRMEERSERGFDRARGLRGIFDLELTRFDALPYDHLEDGHHLRVMRLDDSPVVLHGYYNQVVHAPFLDQSCLLVVVNGG